MSDGTLSRGADAAYRDELIERLGDADPIQELSALFERLPAILIGLSDEQLRMHEAPGKWSVFGVVQHLADVELVQGMRMRRMLVEERPTLVAMDQDVWAERLWRDDAGLEDALDPLRALRVANLHLITGLPEGALERDAQHPERGVESLGTLLKIVAAHDLVHLDQIRRIRAAIGAPVEPESESPDA